MPKPTRKEMDRMVAGAKVRLIGERETATIELVYSDIKDGVRLDRILAGFWSWNRADLRLVKGGQSK